MTTLSRRELLNATWKLGISSLVLGGTATSLSACQPKLQKPPVEPGPFSVWKEVKKALSTSPDNSLGRAMALVERQDLEGLHQFVRDSFRLIPASSHAFTLGDGAPFGVRAALRSGAGTAREKAEVFASLVEKMGMKTKVVHIAPPSDVPAETFFYRAKKDMFAPEMSEAQLYDWRERLGYGPKLEKHLPIEELSGVNPKVQARELLNTLDEKTKNTIGRKFKNVFERGLPVVEVIKPNGEAWFADVVSPQGELKPWPLAVRNYPANPMTQGERVTISLSAETNDPREPSYEIVTGEWSTHELAGRQVRIAFKPTDDTLAVMGSRIADVRSFTPILALQTLDGEVIERETRFKMGETFTLEGDRIEMTNEGKIIKNGADVSDVAKSGKAHHVSHIEAVADATSFPDMQLQLYPRNQSGEIVEGLTRADFAAFDQGLETVLDIENASIAPRIIFLADESLSMPADFRGKDAPKMLPLVEKVEKLAKAIHPEAEVIIKGTGSDLWRNLELAARENASLVVYATDGDVNDSASAEQLALIKAGSKALIMDVTGTLDNARQRYGNKTIFDQLANATDGEAISVTNGDISGIEEKIAYLLDGQFLLRPYTLRYRAPNLDQGNRTVEVRVGSSTAVSDYQVPTNSSLGRKLTAIKLTVKMKHKTVTRLIAGHAGDGEVNREHLDALHGAMFGSHLLAFEGAIPSISNVMQDILQAKLSMENMHKTAEAEERTVDDMINSLEAGFDYLPGHLASFLGRTTDYAGKDFCFVERGLRTVYYSEHPVINTTRFLRKVDIMPFSNTHVFARDKTLRLEKAFEASLGLANAETALFATSTGNLLRGQALTQIDQQKRDKNLSREQREMWRQFDSAVKQRIGPDLISLTGAGYETFTSWTIDKRTGEVYGMLSDASGGGSYEDAIQQQLAEVDKVISMLNVLVMAVGWAGGVGAIGGAALGIVAAYGQRLARLYAAVSVTVIVMDASGLDAAVEKVIQGMVCEVAKAIAMTSFAEAGRLAASAADLLTVSENVFGKSPLNCPL